VQAADFGTLHDLPRRRKLDRPELGCVLVEREVGARLMVIGKVSGQDTAKVSLACRTGPLASPRPVPWESSQAVKTRSDSLLSIRVGPSKS
jgi:hypothetical protein